MNILTFTIAIVLLDPAWTRTRGWNFPKKQRISLTKCLEYKELIAQNITFGGMSMFSEQRTIIKYECKAFSGMIVGGVEAKPGEFPHMAALGFKDSTGNVEFFCGGSLISENFVLTAAHCIEGDGPNVVRLGGHDFSRVTDNAKPVDCTIKKKHIHEEYNLATKENDIALIELKSPVKFNAFVRPACLSQSIDIEESVIASGWGQLGTFKDTSDVLMKVALDTVNSTYCYEKLGRDISAPMIYPSQICAGGKAKKDTCRGDSGGPIQVSHANYSCIYDIVGLTSYGLFKCGSKVPAVYTNVAYFLDWIEEKVWP